MHTSNVRTSSTPASVSASGLRPRNTRLISGLDEGDEATHDPATAPATRIASPVPSPLDSRSASPIPKERLSRAAAGQKAASLRARGGESPTAALAGLWGNSWSTLQGLASDLLGDSASDTEQQGRARTRRTLSRLQVERGSSSAPPREWGPTSSPIVGSGSIGVGSREDVEREVRARKRKDMLMRREPSYADGLGRSKRRTSDEIRGGGGTGSSSVPPGEGEHRDALVYLHHVQKEDTLAGITIRYNCSAHALRKANRMWPNDTVQSRRILTLPVDACGVKGKPVSGPEAMDLLGDDTEALFAGLAEEVNTPNPPLTNGSDSRIRDRTNSASTNTSNRTSAAISSSSVDPAYQHDSWVLLPNATKPTEIARLSRQNLAYFPPARRKSNSYSDLDTPSTSLDLVRTASITSPSTQGAPQRPRRTRKLSNASTGYFPSYLAGPGGVGSMGKSVSSPGPAQDGLNKMFARHLPDVAPPRNQQALYQPELPLYTDAGTPVAGSGAATPNAAPNLNLENLGGAVESWVRRVAAKAQSALEPAESGRGPRVNVGTPGKGAGVGDLIEMTDEFEIGGDDEDDGRGRAGAGESSGYFGSAVASAGTRQREHRGDYSGKAGKSD